jgi:NDP-sugar pyrophosphorylase family protein
MSVVPSGQKLDMPTLLEQRIALNDVVNIFPIYEYWLDIGRMEDFQRAQYDMEAAVTERSHCMQLGGSKGCPT